MKKWLNIDSLSDQELVSLLLQRDRNVTEAFFYRKCYPLFKAFYDNYETDCESCIEFINEIYLYLMLPNKKTQLSYMQGFSFRCGLMNWIRIVVKSYCIQLFRKKDGVIKESIDKIIEESQDDSDRYKSIPDSLSVEYSYSDREDLMHVLTSMPNLRYRELIRLRYFEGQSNEETANILNMSMDVFYNKHLLAKKQFITALKKEGLL